MTLTSPSMVPTPDSAVPLPSVILPVSNASCVAAVADRKFGIGFKRRGTDTELPFNAQSRTLLDRQRVEVLKIIVSDAPALKDELIIATRGAAKRSPNQLRTGLQCQHVGARSEKFHRRRSARDRAGVHHRAGTFDTICAASNGTAGELCNGDAAVAPMAMSFVDSKKPALVRGAQLRNYCTPFAVMVPRERLWTTLCKCWG